MITNILNILDKDPNARDISDTILISSNSQRETYDSITAVPAPKGTRTHTPIENKVYIDLVAQLISEIGWAITAATYASSFEQGNCHFVFQVDRELAPGVNMQIAGHHSNIKMKSAVLYLQGENQGANCTNMEVVGEVQLRRKHTPRILLELPELIHKALLRLDELAAKHQNRMETYMHWWVSDEKASDLMIKALENEAIPSTYIHDVLQEWRNPSHESFQARNLYSLYNCFTAAWRKTPASTPKRSKILLGMFDEVTDPYKPTEIGV